VIIGTAGHIDHGKSALVQALTGSEMDPLAEERRRGITLDLHVVALRLAGGRVAGIIDVPGHEDLVRTMVAGASGIDLVLLVVAADEGIMPQTREHLAVVEQLGIPRGIPVLSRIDLVDASWLALVESEVAAWLRPSPIVFSPPVRTSARTGEGVDALRALIDRHDAETPARAAPGDLPRLDIDRAFTLPGIGTVVTGSAGSGVFRVGDPVRVLPGAAAGRIRSLQRHELDVSESTPGTRVALALAGVSRAEVRRGQVVVRTTDPWDTTGALDVTLTLLPAAPRPLAHQTRVRIALGTSEVMARVHAGSSLRPGSSTMARLALETPLLARAGDRFVVRSYSPAAVIGGGHVLDPLPPGGRPVWSPGLSSDDPTLRLRALLERHPRGLSERQLPVRVGVPPSAVQGLLRDPEVVSSNGMVVARVRCDEAAKFGLALVTRHAAQHPADRGTPLQSLRQALSRFGAAAEPAMDALVKEGQLVVDGDVAREPGTRQVDTAADGLENLVIRLVVEGGLAPPSVPELEAAIGRVGVPAALHNAVRTGRLIAVARDRYFGVAALSAWQATLTGIAARGDITPAAIRAATGLSRKFIIPLLEWSDRSGLTVRTVSGRSPGPVLAAKPR
jgi:selenocysteine-specific elongation factor